MLRTLALIVVTCCSATAVQGKVLAVHVKDRAPVDYSLAEQRPYERVIGQVVIGLDPDDRDNWQIVDLTLAPKNRDGLVTAIADFAILRPVDKDQDASIALVEIPNRGGKAMLRYFNGATNGSASLTQPDEFGDGYLMELGLTLVWIGWQADVPTVPNRMRLTAPIARGEDGQSLTGLVRSDWTMTARTNTLDVAHRNHTAYPIIDDPTQMLLTWRTARDGDRKVVPAEQWTIAADRTSVESESGFKGGGVYELVYPSRDPVVVGMGLAAVRDFVSFLKNDRDSPARVNKTIAIGISQTGRFLRHFLYQGFNLDERKRQVFDGVWIHTAGAGRGSFNHRFAQPSRDGHRYSAFYYPTDLFPFSGAQQTDPLQGPFNAGTGGLFMRYAERKRPKVMYTNTGYEYWGRAASLLHTTPDGTSDVDLLPNERLYHLAGAQHYVHRSTPQEIPRTKAVRGNWLNFLVNLRALAGHMVNWVAEDQAPPNSQYPRIDKQQLVPIEQYRWRTVDGVRRPHQLHLAHRVDYGPRWSQGIVDKQPPDVGPPFGVLVPQLDLSGNEMGGVRNVEVRVPVASFLPWALRFDNGDAFEMDDFHGTVTPIPQMVTQGDWRTPLNELYADEVDYRQKVQVAIDELIEEGFVLPRDRQQIAEQAITNWYWSQSR